MTPILTRLFQFGPLVFAFGFLMPLIAQTIERIEWVPPYDLSPLAFGGIVAAVLGLTAQIRGTWI